jgi:DNA-binding MarR family transcriptional regulator
MSISTPAAQKTDAILRDVVRLFAQAQRTMTACCSGATAKECEALMLIARNDRLTVQDFASQMGLEKTWASRLLVRMEKDGLIRRVDHPDDGRSWLIELTASSRMHSTSTP